MTVAVALAALALAAAPDASWLAYGHDGQVTNFTPAPAFTAKVKGFTVAWHASVDGGLVAQPLAAPIAGKGLVTFVATTKGNVYAIGPTGAQLWERSLGTVTTNGNCGIYGVDSTGVVDTKRGVLYVIGARGTLHALKLADGTDAAGWPVRVVRRVRTEYVWGGLRLVGDRIYAGVASYCDAPDRNGVPAEGRLMAFDVDEPAQAPAVFDPVPGADNLGGIWGWGGVAVAGTDIFTGIGDAEPDLDDGYSDSMVEVTSDLSEVVSANRPVSAPGEDIDLGAAPVLFHPLGCKPFLAGNSKSGELLVWREDALQQGVILRVPLSDGISSFVGAPAWSPRTQMLYDGGVTEEKNGSRLTGTLALAVTTKCKLVEKWFTQIGSGTEPQPLVAGDLVASAGGFGGGYAVNRASSGVAVWRFQTDGAALAPLIEAGGLLIGGDMGGNVYAFKPR